VVVAQRGDLTVVLSENERELLLSLLSLHRMSLIAVMRISSESSVTSAWNETIGLQAKIEGPLALHNASTSGALETHHTKEETT
jgi:hypothetical protein